MSKKIFQLISSYLYIMAVLYITHILQGDQLTVYFVGIAALIILELFAQRQNRPSLYQKLGLGLGMLTYLWIFINPVSWKDFWHDTWIFILLAGLILLVPRLYIRQNLDQEREKHQRKYDD